MIRKIAVIAIILLAHSSYSFAGDEAVLSLFEGTPEAATPATVENEQENGLFSFLNFKIPFVDHEIKEKKMNAFDETLKAAEDGDIESQLLLGYSYLYGENGLKPDYEKAFEYYGKAALQNDPTGLNNLGSLYYSGVGVGRSSAKAAILFQKAAELGNPDAAVNLGFILMTGNGAKQDKKEALKYFEMASATENAIAKFMTGYAYYIGYLRTKDYMKAAPLIRYAADAGIDEAQLVLADIYMEGKGFPKNYNNAVKYMRLAASQGNTEAMMSLANVLASGEKYNKDIDFAYVLYNLSSVRGVSEASEKLQGLESKMKIKEVLSAQQRAEEFVEKPSAMTTYIHQTYGKNLRDMF